MEYKTTDTALASYLIIQGFLPSLIDYSGPRYTFVFTNSAESIHDHASRYVTGLARVDPATYHRVNRKLNRILHNHLQWEDD